MKISQLYLVPVHELVALINDEFRNFKIIKLIAIFSTK